MKKQISKPRRGRKRMILDAVLTAFGITAFLTTEATGLHIAAAALFGLLAVWHACSRRALPRTALRRMLSRKKEPRPLFYALDLALLIAIVATFATGLGEVGIGIAAGHRAFANTSLLLASAHLALSRRRILMLAGGGKLGKRTTKRQAPSAVLDEKRQRPPERGRWRSPAFSGTGG